MSAQSTENRTALTNGPGAAAILSAGIGSFMLAIFAMAADKVTAIKNLMIFWKPTGPLSGVTTCAIAVWLVVWLVLDRSWAKRDVPLTRISAVAMTLLVLGLLLTFPPIADLL